MCKCGTSCKMSNGRNGVCQQDDKTCAQNFHQPICSEGKKYFTVSIEMKMSFRMYKVKSAK